MGDRKGDKGEREREKRGNGLKMYKKEDGRGEGEERIQGREEGRQKDVRSCLVRDWRESLVG